jgi:hypothetical protein
MRLSGRSDPDFSARESLGKTFGYPHRVLFCLSRHKPDSKIAWRDLPAAFGPWQTVWKRHRRLSADGN